MESPGLSFRSHYIQESTSEVGSSVLKVNQAVRAVDNIFQKEHHVSWCTSKTVENVNLRHTIESIALETSLNLTLSIQMKCLNFTEIHWITLNEHAVRRTALSNLHSHGNPVLWHDCHAQTQTHTNLWHICMHYKDRYCKNLRFRKRFFSFSRARDEQGQWLWESFWVCFDMIYMHHLWVN